MSRASGYEEVLALEFFRRAIANYDGKGASPDLFGPLVRNLDDESVIFAIRDQMLPAPTAADSPRERREYARWRKQCEDESAFETCACLWNTPFTHEQFRKKALLLVDELLPPLRSRTADDPLRQRIEELKTTLRLDENELNIVLVLWLIGTDRLAAVTRTYAPPHLTGFLNLCTGMGEQAVRAAFRNSARLCRFGIVSSRDHSELMPKVRYFLDGISDEPLASSFYKKDSEAALPLGFFGEMAKKHVPILKKMLAGRSERGLNILLYGAPGTGKTSFARALAAETGRTCYQVAQRPKDRYGEYTAAKAEIRYAAIEICNEQTDPASSLVVVDEADSLLRCTNIGVLEMFGRASSVTGDKGLLNDILEKNKTPTIWITNTGADELDLSNRRRFDYSIRFDPLTKEQRVGIWRNAAAKAGLAKILTKKDIVGLVERYPVNTGIAARAFENVACLGASRSECRKMVEALLDRQCELSGLENQANEAARVPDDYSLEGLNIKSKVSLDKVILAAKRFLDSETRKDDRDAPRMNILLSGVPGSGKTEFVKYLSSRLGRPLCMRKPSDLKSKWVGETEQNIAAAFREARDRKAVLFFDEIDSFLDNREALRQGHEKSMVNEVLQQMESFGGMFVGTTNFAGMLDPAVARRFTFKIQLDYLTPAGRRHFFKKFFDAELSPEEADALDRIELLTPGDFRTVRQELFYLGDDVSNADRISALEEEVLAKSVGKCAKIGF
ncbi:MAG: AAA family ATPase [Kiritimatiellae bacterium]|nr:AAA family ATPase [Kiritimatiellia bacterium]